MKILQYTLLLFALTLTAQANVTPRFTDVKVQVYGTDVNGDPTFPWEINSSGWGSVDVQHSVLPDGAATLAEQQTQTSELININGHLVTLEGYLDGVESKLDTVNSNLVTIQGKQDTGNASLASIDSTLDVLLSTRASEATLSSFQSANHTDLLGVQSRIDTSNTHLSSIDTDIDVALSTRASEATLSSFQSDNHTDLLGVQTRQDTTNTRLGDLTETAPSTDTASSGLNGRLQRIAQRLTTLIGFYANNFGSIANAIRTAAQLGDGAGNAITSQSYDSVRPLHTYLMQVGASNATHTRITLVANVSTQILAANTARKWAYIDNQSGANIFIKFGTAAVINQSLQVTDKETFKMSMTELYLGAVNAIVGSNNRTIEIIEGF